MCYLKLDSVTHEHSDHRPHVTIARGGDAAVNALCLLAITCA